MNVKSIKSKFAALPAYCGLVVSLSFVVSCSDMFDTNPTSIIQEKEYISKTSEMYKGFMGIVTRVQEAGDQAIFLTDTRANVLETTSNAPSALQDIYNYKNTNGNEYADPTCYYAIVIACNDYISKMGEFHRNVGGMLESDETNFTALLSSAVRLKVWAYYMLGKIYGTAYWFDDPLTEMKDLTDASVFTLCDMGQLATRCINLLEQGITVDGLHVASDLTMQWYKWLDEENQDQATYMKWQYLVPPRIILEAVMRSWRASYESEETAQSDWLWIRDNLNQWLYDLRTCKNVEQLQCPGFTSADYSYERDGVTVSGINGVGYLYQTNLVLQSDATYPYYSMFFSEGIDNRVQDIAGIMYDYDNHQTNRLVQYFCPEYPDVNSFYLQPSEYGLSLYNSSDLRGQDQCMVINTLGGKVCLTKYYYTFDATPAIRTHRYLKDNIFEIMPTILMFRGHDIHFLMAEAENHLGNWQVAAAMLNNGFGNVFPQGFEANESVLKDLNYKSWFSSMVGYGDVGIVGCVNGTEYSLPTPDDDGYNLTEMQRREIYDWALASECLKEYVGEGKAYPYLCKIAQRWNGSNGRGSAEAATDSIVNRIAPKYAATGKAGNVRSYLQQHGHFIDWDLQKLR